MNDPLAGYPDTFSTITLARLLKCSYPTAARHIREMPHFNVGFGNRRENRRVSKEDVRARFYPHTIRANLRLVR